MGQGNLHGISSPSQLQASRYFGVLSLPTGELWNLKGNGSLRATIESDQATGKVVLQSRQCIVFIHSFVYFLIF